MPSAKKAKTPTPGSKKAQMQLMRPKPARLDASEVAAIRQKAKAAENDSWAAFHRLQAAEMVAQAAKDEWESKNKRYRELEDEADEAEGGAKRQRV